MKPNLLLSTLFAWCTFLGLANDTLNPCLQGQAFHIVVLGSSTAAGSGPSSSDSTWVNRYRRFLQQINPANQVTNLAQGGTNTYQIMPDWFTPPPGRPVTNPSRNVSEAITLGADAIIVNMPSNDAAGGFTLNEQMFNFNMIVRVADSVDIPVWVCTTQPRNFSTAKIQLQKDVRDSILSAFGNKAIDFWTGMADTTGTIDPAYDSGDGVHLNDAAHRILFQRVQGKNILSALVDTTAPEDHFIYNPQLYSSICGSSHDSVHIYIINSGAASNYDLPVEWSIEDLTRQTISYKYDTLQGGLNSCAVQKRTATLNTTAGGHWRITAILLTQNDTALTNDTVRMEWTTTGLPDMVAAYDTVCKNQPATLWASGADTTLWYDAQGNFISYGDSLHVPGAGQSQSFKASVVKGPLYFIEKLTAATVSNVNFPGIMFDLIAQDTLVIDSLTLKIQSLGQQQVKGYFKYGTYKGFEDSVLAWTSWGADSVDIAQASSWATVQFGTKTLMPGDTLGVYLEVQGWGQLEYQRATSEVVFSDSHLSIVSGTGVARNFGTPYYPRIWNGSIHYHHGYNPTGYCAKDSLIAVIVPSGQISLGADTVLDYSQSLTLNLGAGFSNIRWSTGDTTAQITLDSTRLSGNGPHHVFVQAIDKWGCTAADTIHIEFAHTTGRSEYGRPTFAVYPNPTAGEVTLQWNYGRLQTLQVYNLNGVLLNEIILPPGPDTQTLNLPGGIYFLQLKNSPHREPIKLVVH